MKSYAITEVTRRAAARPYAAASEQNEAISTATARTFAILDLVAHAQAAVEVSSVIETLALPKATAYRLVDGDDVDEDGQTELGRQQFPRCAPRCATPPATRCCAGSSTR